MEFAIQVLKQKKEEIKNEYANETEFVKIIACKMMCEDLDKAVKTLEYEYYWKHLNEKQVTEKLGITR
ncbi:hypothetical protein AB0Y20_01250 [Heyndrickxia oleronia]|uniref:hypothetical protein n=1 Tax=Heyndrickxia oleronia TaxID=38875 RepID=UPI003F1F526E